MQEKKKASFLNMLTDHQQGHMLILADNALSEVLDKIQEDSGKAELVMKFSFKGGKKSSPGVRRVDVTCDVSTKLPKTSPEPSTFYTTPAGELSKKHPSQIEMFEDDPKVVKE